ncbi:hypothetical protein EV361DRAFT_911280 [Lentinula raphanica]|nr:hypothetical protein EV361DRAFT_911280 [Lentinula raphanica]
MEFQSLTLYSVLSLFRTSIIRPVLAIASVVQSMSNMASAAVVYNASVNPSRRAKVTRMTERTILPKQSGASDNATATVALASEPDHDAPVTTAKRGRKPASNASGLSRSAREAQRKLNHSIIEKARRTKINEALAELARLGVTVEVLQAGGTLEDAESSTTSDHLGKTPPGKASLAHHEDDDNDGDTDNDDDRDGTYGPPSSSRTRSGGGSKSEHSKDHDTASKAKDKFKLDILIKTVENMQFLLQRVRGLEAELQDAKSSPSHLHPTGSEDFECGEYVERTLAHLPSTSAFTTNKRKRYSSAEFRAANDEFLEDTYEETRKQTRRKVVHDTRGRDHDGSPLTRTLPSLPSISSWLLDPESSTPSVYSSRDTLPTFVARSSSSSPSMISSNSLPILAGLDRDGSQSRKRSMLADIHSPSLAPYLPSPPSSTRLPASVLASSNGVPNLELGPSSVTSASVSANTASPTFSFSGRSSSKLSISTNAPEPSFLSSASKDLPVASTTNAPTTSGRPDTAYTVRSPEEECAASLLLHMKSSPPVFMTARTRRDSTLEKIEPLPLSMTSPKFTSEKSHPSFEPDGQSAMIVQTPSSMLGLETLMN